MRGSVMKYLVGSRFCVLCLLSYTLGPWEPTADQSFNVWHIPSVAGDCVWFAGHDVQHPFSSHQLAALYQWVLVLYGG